ncbi:MAG: YdcH family protein [Pseudomonadota bacterium]
MMRLQGLSVRIDAMRRRHREIDSSVAAEQRRPYPDTALLQALKRRRLRLKDALLRYEGVLRTVARGQAAA